MNSKRTMSYSENPSVATRLSGKMTTGSHANTMAMNEDVMSVNGTSRSCEM